MGRPGQEHGAEVRPRWVAAALLGVAAISPGAAAQTAAAALSELDFLTNWRELRGREVAVPCQVMATTADFIRCEAAGDAGSFALDAETMDRADLKLVYRTCPGTRIKRTPACRFLVAGTVYGRVTPSLKAARFAAPPQ